MRVFRNSGGGRSYFDQALFWVSDWNANKHVEYLAGGIIHDSVITIQCSLNISKTKTMLKTIRGVSLRNVFIHGILLLDQKEIIWCRLYRYLDISIPSRG